MQNRVQSAKKPRRLFTFGWSLLCWPSYRDTLFIGLARKAATSSCLALFIHRVTMEVLRPHSFAHSTYPGCIFLRDLICLPSHLLVGSSGMRFLGRCWVQINLCLWRRVAWVLSGSSLDANKSRWSNGIPYTLARIFFQDEFGEKNLITDRLLQLYGKNNL